MAMNVRNISFTIPWGRTHFSEKKTSPPYEQEEIQIGTIDIAQHPMGTRVFLESMNHDTPLLINPNPGFREPETNRLLKYHLVDPTNPRGTFKGLHNDKVIVVNSSLKGLRDYLPFDFGPVTIARSDTAFSIANESTKSPLVVTVNHPVGATIAPSIITANAFFLRDLIREGTWQSDAILDRVDLGGVLERSTTISLSAEGRFIAFDDNNLVGRPIYRVFLKYSDEGLTATVHGELGLLNNGRQFQLAQKVVIESIKALGSEEKIRELFNPRI